MSKQNEAMYAENGMIHDQPPPSYSQPPGYMYNTAPGMQQPVMMVVAPVMDNPPSDNMIFNIIVTIFCCWPIGIFGIMKSMACKEAITRNDRTTAEQFSRQARRLGFWALGVGIAFMVLSVTAVVLIYAVWIIPMYTKYDRHD